MSDCAYIGGPMRGRPNFGFDAFDGVATMLRAKDEWTIFSPAEHDREVWPELESAPGFAEGDLAIFDRYTPPNYTFASLMRWDLNKVSGCEHLVLLPGWEGSSGARTERCVAEETGSRIWLAYHSYGEGWYIVLDPVQKRMSPAAVEAAPVKVGPLHHRDPEPVLAAMRRVEGEDIAALERGYHDSDIESYENQRRADEGIDPRNVDGTTIQTSETGGQKGAKAIELDRIPQAALRQVAKHFHDGSEKYPDVAPGVANWSLGYDWSLSVNALGRHLSAWLDGEDLDPELGNNHLAAVAFHALVLLEFQGHGWGTDDRRIPARREEYLA